MSSSSLIVVAVWLIAAAGHTRGKCCPQTYMTWTAERCWPFTQQNYMENNNESDLSSTMQPPTRCEAKVCNDGREHDGLYCGKGKCHAFGCKCDGGCIEGDPVENFRRIHNLPDADRRDSGAWLKEIRRDKRSNAFSTMFRNSRAGAKLAKSAYNGYKEGQLSADMTRRDRERALNNAFTVPPPSLVQQANQMHKPGW